MLRIGVVLDGMRAPAWAAWVLRAIRAHDDLDLTLAVIADRIGDERPFGPLRGVRRGFDRHRPTLEPVDVSRLRSRASRACSPGLGDGTRRNARLPRVGAGPREIPLVPRHGVWSLHLGDPIRYRGAPLFWELFFAESASTSVPRPSPEVPRNAG